MASVVEPRDIRITLIGTGHVFDIGAKVREEIRRRSPQVVGIELDPPRFHALRSKTKDRKGLPLSYRILVAATLAGFPLAIVLSWLYDIRADGIRRTRPAAASWRAR